MKKQSLKIFFACIMTITQIFLAVTPAAAVSYMGGCNRVGQCVNNKTCVADNNGIVYPNGGACGSSQLGGVQLPASIRNYNLIASNNSNNPKGIGIIVFMSALVRVFLLVCGLWTLFNFLYSGYLFVSAQTDTKVYQEVKDRLTMTMIGLGVIAGAYMLAALIGLVFFGDAGFILNPTLQGALSK